MKDQAKLEKKAARLAQRNQGNDETLPRALASEQPSEIVVLIPGEEVQNEEDDDAAMGWADAEDEDARMGPQGSCPGSHDPSPMGDNGDERYLALILRLTARGRAPAATSTPQDSSPVKIPYAEDCRQLPEIAHPKDGNSGQLSAAK
ncbi:hypothetical protein R3P38DRAFT_2768488 [Favolaschia claudopus]|uniref:Uncharacterized protein n=1 Tax=Favolaschia claudopus TaxID=2862362 RepID=A0AAW0CPY0_9AGAR